VKVAPTALDGVLLIEPQVFADARGFMLESYHVARYSAAGLPAFVQDNHSRSARGTIRGLHYQLRHPQAKLVRVVRGAAFDVAVDIRRRSPAFGRWVSVELSADNTRQLFIPAGFAHGFCALEEGTEVEYKCSDYYVPDDQHGVRWDDPAIGIPWPVGDPLVSERDRAYLPLRAARDDLPS
jgi:dTDP-4-dehydrorhamnose 3,5-epimerase